MNFFGNYFHVYNRGVEKRKVFSNRHDYERFVLCLREFNNHDSFVEIRELVGADDPFSGNPISGEISGERDKLVEIVAYCLNPNHYHLLLKEVREGGVAKFMQRVGIGYTNYFNKKNNRSGVLFQGKYKKVEVKSNEQLLYLSAYVNANHYIHKIDEFDNWEYSSFFDYLGQRENGWCNTDPILKQFKSNRKDYKKFCLDTSSETLSRRIFTKSLLV
jgi:putative transposase